MHADRISTFGISPNALFDWAGTGAKGQQVFDGGGVSRWRDCRSAAPPSAFSRCVKNDAGSASAE